MNNLKIIINYISSSTFSITYLDLVNFCITENLLLTLKIYSDLIFRLVDEHNNDLPYYDRNSVHID